MVKNFKKAKLYEIIKIFFKVMNFQIFDIFYDEPASITTDPQNNNKNSKTNLIESGSIVFALKNIQMTHICVTLVIQQNIHNYL